MTPTEAVGQAEVQLRVAEADLESITNLINARGDQAQWFTMRDLVANADARTRLGLAWVDLAAALALIP